MCSTGLHVPAGQGMLGVRACLAGAIQGSKQQLVQVAVEQQCGVLIHHMVHHCVHLHIRVLSACCAAPEGVC